MPLRKPRAEPVDDGVALVVDAALRQHLELEAALDQSLRNVVADTESSAMAIIAHVRRLHESSSKLVAYLDGTGTEAGDLGKELVNSVSFLVDIGSFLRRLAPKMERDRDNVQAVVEEIKQLGGMAEEVQKISRQSHMLGINAAIEASKAGAAGAAFTVLAGEMRELAKSSGAAAARIGKGLSRARSVVEGQMAASIAESAEQLDDVSRAGDVIGKLSENFEDMSQYYKTRFAIVTQHNEDLARDIANTLGQVQYQDVVRQCIERIQVAVRKRNEALCAALTDPSGGAGRVRRLPEQLRLIHDEYLSGEARHKHSTREAAEETGDLKIELF